MPHSERIRTRPFSKINDNCCETNKNKTRTWSTQPLDIICSILFKMKKETNDCVKFEHKLKFIKIVDIFVNNLFVFCCPLKFKISQLESLEMSPFLSFYWHANQNMAQVVWMSEAMKLEQKKEYRQNCQFQEFFFFFNLKKFKSSK